MKFCFILLALAISIATLQQAKAQESTPCTEAHTRSEMIFQKLSETALQQNKIRRILPLNFECTLSFNAAADLDGVRFSEAYTSILNDEELAAVLAHEIAHEYTFNAPTNEDSRFVTTQALTEDQYTNESNADINGIYLMSEAGFDPNSAVSALEKIVAADGDTDDHFHLQLSERKALLLKTILNLK